MRSLAIVLFFTLASLSCQSRDGQKEAEMPSSEKHLFYLHGRIIELQGLPAESPQFGPYEYAAIIDSFRQNGFVVHHQVRTATTDFFSFVEALSLAVDSLLNEQVAPSNITVVGASKGAVMSMYLSHLNPAPIRYVLLGANNDQIEEQFDWQLHGTILGVYEASDLLAGKNYHYWASRSPKAERFEQLRLNTGLDHGFFYRPIQEWLKPTIAWAKHGQL